MKCRRCVSRVRLAKIFFAGLVLSLLLTGVRQAGAAATCQPVGASLLVPSETLGVRTKWKYEAMGRGRNSIQPDTFGLPLQEWAAALESAGVNLADLNLDPREKIGGKDVITQAQAADYIANADVPATKLDKDRLALRSRLEDKLIPTNQYSLQFRDRTLLEFLSKLDTLRKDGKIAGSVKFLLHQRQWFRPGNSARRKGLRASRVDGFSSDMADFINLAHENCLDQWIAGIRLGENFTQDPSIYLQAVADIAQQVNKKTGGWLKDRMFVANGMGMGAQYNGITLATDKSFDFFDKISKQTGSFAFGYKWMQSKKNGRQFIARIMDSARCEGGADCDVHSKRDWAYYLGQKLGFIELRDMINALHGKYPRHANVLFVGDSSDSVRLMSDSTADGLTPQAELNALYDLWPDSGKAGWRGRIFLNAFANDSTFPRDNLDRQPDRGLALFYVDKKGQLDSLPLSRQIWMAWPERP